MIVIESMLFLFEFVKVGCNSFFWIFIFYIFGLFVFFGIVFIGILMKIIWDMNYVWVICVIEVFF